MNIIPVPAFHDNYIWLINNGKSQCFCVDPGDAKPVLAYLHANQLDLSGILITHHHLDHIGGVDDLLSHYPDIVIYGPKDHRIPQVTHPVFEGEEVHIFNLKFEVLSIPGHTSSHIAYFNESVPILFCGDTLFSAGCGRVFDGTIEKLYDSLSKISQLPLNTNIYCAHEYTLNNCRFAQTIEPNNQALTDKIHLLESHPNQCSIPNSLQNEKLINPFLRAIDQTLELTWIQTLSPFETFKKLRALKDNF